MAVAIRLKRVGKPKRAFYRVVAVDSRKKRDGKPIEVLGFYDPQKEGANLNINTDRLKYWVENGAQMSATVSTLMKKNT